MRIRVFVLVVAAFTMVTLAQAGTITVTFTSASAGAINCYHTAPLSASCSDSNSVGSGSSVADVLSGHLGAAVSANSVGYVSAGSMAVVAMSLKDFTDQDLMEIDMSMQGSFYNGGAAGTVYVDDGNSVTTYGVFCGDGIVFLYNRPCNPAGGVEKVTLDLALYDNLTLTFLLQPGITNVPGYASFLNSFDSTIKVPNGTVIVNGPGGTLFQPQSSTVPEPASLPLIASGLIAFLAGGRRKYLH